MFELFFLALERKETLADIHKFGLTQFAKRYEDNTQWGGIENATDYLEKPEMYIPSLID